MEYLSLPHSRASSHKLVPEVDDELLTNLRNPIITMVEDSTPGAHDTLTAACDANQYAALGVDKPEEHGSCAENLVLALKELNETAGLKGAKAIGADISVNIAPTPLHLFMNAPLYFEKADADGAGAKGITLKVEEPNGKKRSFVRFRAERDVVVVFSACPMDVGKQNGGRCMAANFMVEDVQEGEDLAASVSSAKAKKTPKKLASKGKAATASEKKAPEIEKKVPEPKEKAPEAKEKTPAPEKAEETPAKEVEEKAPEPEKKKAAPKKLAPKKDAADEKKPAAPKAAPQPPKEAEKEAKKEEPSSTDEPKPKKKPRKLAPRGGAGSVTPTKSS